MRILTGHSAKSATAANCEAEDAVEENRVYGHNVVPLVGLRDQLLRFVTKNVLSSAAN